MNNPGLFENKAALLGLDCLNGHTVTVMTVTICVGEGVITNKTTKTTEGAKLLLSTPSSIRD